MRLRLLSVTAVLAFMSACNSPSGSAFDGNSGISIPVPKVGEVSPDLSPNSGPEPTTGGVTIPPPVVVPPPDVVISPPVIVVPPPPVVVVSDPKDWATAVLKQAPRPAVYDAYFGPLMSGGESLIVTAHGDRVLIRSPKSGTLKRELAVPAGFLPITRIAVGLLDGDSENDIVVGGPAGLAAFKASDLLGTAPPNPIFVQSHPVRDLTITMRTLTGSTYHRLLVATGTEIVQYVFKEDGKLDSTNRFPSTAQVIAADKVINSGDNKRQIVTLVPNGPKGGLEVYDIDSNGQGIVRLSTTFGSTNPDLSNPFSLATGALFTDGSALQHSIFVAGGDRLTTFHVNGFNSSSGTYTFDFKFVLGLSVTAIAAHDLSGAAPEGSVEVITLGRVDENQEAKVIDDNGGTAYTPYATDQRVELPDRYDCLSMVPEAKPNASSSAMVLFCSDTYYYYDSASDVTVPNKKVEPRSSSSYY